MSPVVTLQMALPSQSQALSPLTDAQRPYPKSVMHRVYGAILRPPYLFRALHISIVTSTDRAMVVGYRDSKISQSIPSKMGLSSVHLMKFLCRHRKPLVNTWQSSSVGKAGRLVGGHMVNLDY